MLILARLKPIAAPFVSRLLRQGFPETEVLHPEEREAVTPPALLPGMLERVTGTDEHSRLEEHLEAIQATEVTHAPVLRRMYRKAVVRRGGFATWGRVVRHDQNRGFKGISGPIEQIDTLRYCESYVSWRYFGHWLIDAVPTALIGLDSGPAWLPPAPDWPHAVDYSEVFGLSVAPAALVQADDLIVYQDFSQGSSKRARYDVLRDRLRARFGGSGKAECVYLKRGATGTRRVIHNEAYLIEALTARGWTVLDVATASVETLQQALLKARVVVSLDGSHLNHVQIAMPQGGAIVVLVPNDRFTSVQAGYAVANRLSVGMVVLEGTQQAGYAVSSEEVLRTAALIAS